MPANKDFKRLVRARMGKTGEAYTTARSQLLKRPKRRSSALAPELAPQPAAAPDYAALAGMADATIAARTGCTWERWVDALDHVGAHEWVHRDIARYVHEKYKVPDWWTQAVTVGYERIKGLRAIGQRRGGGYEASKSKVFAVPVARLYRAFHDPRTRRRWLGANRLAVRTATAEKSMRIAWPDGTAVDLYFVAKGAGRSQLAIQHRKLADKASADRMKEWWAERLAALAGLLQSTKR
jgi:hypothetical protein